MTHPDALPEAVEASKLRAQGIEIKPCPFCGSAAKFREGTFEFKILCTFIGVCPGNADDGLGCISQADALRIWNRRALITPADKGAPEPPLTIIYTNWRGETAEREIVPLRMWHGATDWHPEPQWLLKAWDVEKQAERDFAWNGIDFQGDGPALSTREAIPLEAGPSDADIAHAAQYLADMIVAWDAGTASQVPLPANLIERSLTRLLAARRIQPDRDGVLEALQSARNQVALLGGEPMAGDHFADQTQMAVLEQVDAAIRAMKDHK